MTSATLAGLPTEILHVIFSTFCLHCRAKDQLIALDAYFRGTQQQRDERSWYSLERHTILDTPGLQASSWHGSALLVSRVRSRLR